MNKQPQVFGRRKPRICPQATGTGFQLCNAVFNSPAPEASTDAPAGSLCFPHNQKTKNRCPRAKSTLHSAGSLGSVDHQSQPASNNPDNIPGSRTGVSRLQRSHCIPCCCQRCCAGVGRQLRSTVVHRFAYRRPLTGLGRSPAAGRTRNRQNRL